MISFWSVLIIVDIALVIATVIIALNAAYRSRLAKKSGNQPSPIGSIGKAVTDLAPNGAVLVDGELWPAVLLDEVEVLKGAHITVVGPRGHLLAVSALQKS
jgi:membrane-bound ClpP family serine protease